ncbi:MAG: LuxE/PaaK family acyltransferase [Candidatus Helarchaeota archaeon]
MLNQNFFKDLQHEVRETAEDCPFYKDLCLDYDFDTTINENNIDEVPYVNWQYFKASNKVFDRLLRIPFKDLDHWTISSSTSGDPSIVGRGTIDVNQFQENYKRVFEDFNHMSSIQKLILFAPSLAFLNRMPGEWMGKRGFLFYRDITDIWDIDTDFLLVFKKLKFLAYVLTHFKIKAFIEVDGKKLTTALNEVETKRMPALIGNSVPLMYKTFKDYKQVKNRTFDMPETFRVQTGGGGWSGIKGRIKTDPIDKGDFIETLSDFFNIDETHFADCFGATESPVACGGHYSKKYNDYLLHVYKDNARIVVRAIETLEPIKKTKEKGVLEILTPYGVKTYTGVAVLLDDLVEIVDFNRCPECGRENVIVFRHKGRLTLDLGKGCSSYTRLFPFDNL